MSYLPPVRVQAQRRPRVGAVLVLALVAVVLLTLATVAVVRATSTSGAEPTAAPATPPPAPTTTTVFLGDSYSAGVGVTAPGYRWPAQVSAQRGWKEVNVSMSGTGYVNDAGGAGTPYPQEVAAAVQFQPQVVVVSGGRNDLNTELGADRATISTAIVATYATLRANLPTATIYAVSPVWDSTTPPSELTWMGTQVRTAVEAVGGTYLDVGEPLQGRRELISADGVHPNDAGYEVLAKAVLGALPPA